MNSNIIAEHGFVNNYEHVEGTNRYIYKYPDSWKDYFYRKHVVSIRSIEVIPAARTFVINGLSIVLNTTKSYNISIDTTLNTHQSMNDFNKELKELTNERYQQIKETDVSTQLIRNSYAFKYDCKDKSFSIYIATTNPYYFHFDNINNIASDDIRIMFNITDGFFEKLAKYLNSGEENDKEELLKCNDMKHITILWRDNENMQGPYVITFHNIWNRERLYITSSLVDMAENEYLGFSNTVFNPPKNCVINNSDSKFNIDLYDMALNPIELPNDKQDTIIIEAILSTV